MTRHTDPKKIEAELERDRASLSATLGELSDRASVTSMAREALGLIRTGTEGYAGTVDAAVRANPLALAVTGAGLIWLLFGRGHKGGPAKLAKKAVPSLSRWEDEGGSPAPDEEPGTDWSAVADEARHKASAAMSDIEAQARSHAASLRDGVAGGVSAAKDFAAEQAAVASDLASRLTDSLKHGLEGVSDAARDKIVAARESAYAARIRGESMARHATRTTATVIEDYPLVAGVVGVAIGAALAIALPRTRTEDRTFGAQSDRLMKDAARALADERRRMGRMAEGMGSALRETADDMADEAGATAARAGRRFEDAVRD